MKFSLLLVFLGLLFAGCGSPSTSWDNDLSGGDVYLDRKPKKEKKPRKVDAVKLNRSLLEIRKATTRFRATEKAEAAGYAAEGACVSTEDGATGIHYVNAAYVADGAFTLAQPEVLIYEPKADGKMKLVAVEYRILKAAWTGAEAPNLNGQPFDVRGGAYSLTVWVWKHNQDGLFLPYNRAVTCDTVKEGESD